jgi:predicted nucleic acid-binding protein
MFLTIPIVVTKDGLTSTLETSSLLARYVPIPVVFDEKDERVKNKHIQKKIIGSIGVLVSLFFQETSSALPDIESNTI